MIRAIIEQYIEQRDVSVDDAAALAAFADWCRKCGGDEPLATITVIMAGPPGRAKPCVMIETTSSDKPAATSDSDKHTVPTAHFAYMLGYASQGMQMQHEQICASLPDLAAGCDACFLQGGVDASRSSTRMKFQEAKGS